MPSLSFFRRRRLSWDGRLQRRMARQLSLVVTISVLVVGAWLTVPRYLSERRMTERRAVTYATLVVDQVAHSANLYRTTGRHLLDRQVRVWMALNPDLVRFDVVHVDGSVVMRADQQGPVTFPDHLSAPVVEDEELLRAVRSLDLESKRVRDDSGHVLYRVVAPAIEEWGRRTYSLVAYFGYRQVDRQLLRSALAVGGFMVIAVFVARQLAVSLATSIAGNVELLRDGLRKIREGKLDERVEIHSDDEIEDLAEAFNEMAETLAETIERLKEVNLELELLDQTKADVVANVSHELKTPLTALRGYLELLEHGSLGPITEQAGRAVAVCQKNLQRLQLRIEELVQLSQWDRGLGTDMPIEEIHLGHLMHGVVETLLPALEEKGVYCSLNLASDLPSIEGSPEHVERLFLNLLGNAGKFTSVGGFVRFTAEPYSRDGRKGVLVRLADTGIGIPEKALLRIFDRFYQVDPSTRRKYGGMGLGLAMVQGIAGAHKGAVWVESQEGRGSVFFVWFPLTQGESSSGQHAIVRRSDSGRMNQTLQRTEGTEKNHGV